jgi:hypothetical protein
VAEETVDNLLIAAMTPPDGACTVPECVGDQWKLWGVFLVKLSVTDADRFGRYHAVVHSKPHQSLSKQLNRVGRSGTKLATKMFHGTGQMAAQVA